MTDRDERARQTHDEEATTTDEGEPLGSGAPEMGIGLDREGTAGTGEHNTGTGLDYDFDERRVTGPDDPEGAGSG